MNKKTRNFIKRIKIDFLKIKVCFHKTFIRCLHFLGPFELCLFFSSSPVSSRAPRTGEIKQVLPIQFFTLFTKSQKITYFNSYLRHFLLNVTNTNWNNYLIKKLFRNYFLFYSFIFKSSPVIKKLSSCSTV